ncbi:hypothetical protein ACROYT_G040525 [Oculina patagonica]
MHAQDAYYHAPCLTALYNRVRNSSSKEEENNGNTSQSSLEAIALAELVMYLEEAPRPMVFLLSDLAKTYSRLLEQLGANVPSRVNSTRLKDRQTKLGAYRKERSVDNIDHNPSSRTAKDSFHGTAISLTEHPTNDFGGIDRNRVLINPDLPKRKTVCNLPEAYTAIQPYGERESKKDYFVPAGCNTNKPQSDVVAENMKSEYQWLTKVEELMEKEKLEEREYRSWSAHFASLQTAPPSPIAITSLLPLFEDNAYSKAMIQHSMKLVKEAIAYLNPGQTPVIGMDQPLFALAKQIQWERAETYEESSYVVMIGGLHIEKASLKMRRAYMASIETIREPDDFNTWMQKQCEAHPHVLFWSTALELELLVLGFVRSIREGNFSMYVEIFVKLVPWMFALDQIHYARWLPIHIRDLVNLKERHPSVFAEFEQGKFVVQKSQHLFSKIALDHNHDQENEMIKGDGGAVG